MLPISSLPSRRFPNQINPSSSSSCFPLTQEGRGTRRRVQNNNKNSVRMGISSNSSSNWQWQRSLGQLFNREGAASLLSVAASEPRLALPHLSVPDIRWVDWPALRRLGFRGVVFDKDNTLTAPYSLSLWPPLDPSFRLCRSAFPAGSIAVFSNSAGLKQFDPDGEEAKALEKSIGGIHVIRHGKSGNSNVFWSIPGTRKVSNPPNMLFLQKLNNPGIEAVADRKTRWRCSVSVFAVLHAGDTNKNGFKALIAAEYSGVQVELAKNFVMGVSNKTPEFLKMNPIGKVPVLETPDGPIFESNAIARYVTRLKADNPLYGCSLIEYAHIEQWIDYASMEIDSNIARWLYPRLGYMPYLAVAEESAISSLKRALGALNSHLASSTYLVGHSVTLADIVMTCNLHIGFSRILVKSFTSEFPHVERYFWTMVNQPNFHKVVGEVKQADSVPPVPSQKKPVQPKEPAKPKEVKKEPKKEPVKPKVQEVMEEEEEAPKPKPKNPLDLLPPSKMILDEWKRLYSNTKTNFREVAIKVQVVLLIVLWIMTSGFWDMYDPEGYSLWFCDYKYNDENTVSFVTLNKVSGFLQRMDLTRKYAFGKMLVIGSEPPFKVKGVWLFRGQEIPKFVLDEVYDMELYDWAKVDISDEAQKERVNAMIEDQEPFEGEALLDAKCFK
ncbi:hypothetical protein MUK42_12909 [Musa troglodytarum]|uniref:Elongation factor 1-gamma n=1 Tax=Musa troglodytarum TaxID=320322 RepID=A0A9E7KQA6_9LILI|nr:hypothetical protein MUK42_12909 [Musa troglodytarum]